MLLDAGVEFLKGSLDNGLKVAGCGRSCAFRHASSKSRQASPRCGRRPVLRVGTLPARRWQWCRSELRRAQKARRRTRGSALRPFPSCRPNRARAARRPHYPARPLWPPAWPPARATVRTSAGSGKGQSRLELAIPSAIRTAIERFVPPAARGWYDPSTNVSTTADVKNPLKLRVAGRESSVLSQESVLVQRAAPLRSHPTYSA